VTGDRINTRARVSHRCFAIIDRDMDDADAARPASGVLHEIDVIAQHEPTVGILELKNRAGWAPEKNDVIVFFAKILDYLCYTPALLRAHLVPIFVSPFSNPAWTRGQSLQVNERDLAR
jgi:hypothetical protein